MPLAKSTADMESTLNSKDEVSVLADTSSPSSSSDLQKNKQIPGISYVLILKSKTKKNTTKFQFDCVLCNLEEELFDGAKMRTHVRSRKHLMNVLELDNLTMFENSKNDTALTDAELFQKVCNCQSGSQTRSVATEETFKSEREMLKTKILQLREACNKIPVSKNLPNSDSDKKMDIKLEKRNSNIGSSPKKSNDVKINDIQSFIEDLGKKQNERHPSKIVFISDGRNEDLTPDKFGGGVQVVKSKKMNLGNVLQNLEKFKLLGKGSVFIVLCGAYSLVSCKVVDDCKKMKCQKQLVNYTINSEISDNTLISKALNLHSYILNKTTNDKVMFCDIVPLNVFKDTVRKCDNNHILENNISNEEYTKYLKILDEYNAFVEDHTRTMGFKNWRLLTNSFPLTDLVTRPLKTTYDYNKVDNQQALSYIVQKSKELLNSLRQIGDEHTVNGIKKFEDSDESKSPKVSKTTISIPVKPSIQARLLSSSKQLQDGKASVTQATSDNAEKNNKTSVKLPCEIQNLQFFTENLALKQKDRNPRKIVLIIDQSNSYIQTEQLGADIETLDAGCISFDNAVSFLEEHNVLGKGCLIIFFCGLYSLVNCDVHTLCMSLKCKKPLLKYELIRGISSEKIIMKALQVHESILNYTRDDQVLFSDLIPINITNKIMRKCSNNHAMRCDIPTDYYANFLKTIEEYNLFIRKHSCIMGYKSLNLLQTAFPPIRDMPLSLNLSSDYSEIDSAPVTKYILEYLREICLKTNASDSKVSVDVSEVTCELFPEASGTLEKNVFKKAVIITYSHYLEYVKNFKGPHVDICVINPTGIDGIVTAIKEKQTTDSSDILWLTHFGLLSITHIVSETSCCTFPPCVSPLDIIVPNKSLSMSKDFVLDIHHHFFSLIEKVNSLMRPSSAFLILPPFPPTFWMGKEEHHLCHSVKREENTIYFPNNREINEIKNHFSLFSKEMISLILSELEKTTIPSKALKDYKDLTKNWTHNVQFLDDVNHKEFNSKFDAWYNAIRVFISDCLAVKRDSRNENNNFLCKDYKSLSPGKISCTINSANILSYEPCMLSSTYNSHDITSEYDYLVFIGPREYLSLLPDVADHSKHIMVVEAYNLDWSNIKSKLNMESLLSCKNILFIIFGHLKLLNVENKSFSAFPNDQNSISFISKRPDSQFEEVMNNIKQLLLHIKISFEGRSRAILLPLLPLRYTQRLLNDSTTIHQIDEEIRMEKKDSNMFHAFNAVWEKEMFSHLIGNEHKFRNAIIQYLPSSTSLWSKTSSTNDLEDLNFLQRKFKFFLRVLIIRACPLIEMKNTLNRVEFFELESSVNQRVILNLNNSHCNKIQIDNGCLKSSCSSGKFKYKNYPASAADQELNFLQHSVSKSNVNIVCNDQLIGDNDVRLHHKSEREDLSSSKKICVDLWSGKKAEEDLTSINKSEKDLSCGNETEKDLMFLKKIEDRKKKLARRRIARKNTKFWKKRRQIMEGKDLSNINKTEEDLSGNKKTNQDLSRIMKKDGDLSSTKETERDLFGIQRTVSKFVVDMSNVQRVGEKFTHAYILGNKELDIRFKKLNNGEHIYYDLSNFSEDDVPIIVNKFGNMKDNSVCFLIFGSEIFAQNIASPSCQKFKCNKTIPVKKLKNTNESFGGVTSFIAEKIVDLMLFVGKLSLYIPVIVLPFIPEMLCCDDGNCFMKHAECHSIANFGSYIVHGRIENWRICSAIVKDIWNNFVKATYHNYFLSEDLDKYVNEMNALVFEDKVNKYSFACPELSHWESVLSALLNILLDISSTDLNEKPPELSTSKELEALKSNFIVCAKTATQIQKCIPEIHRISRKRKKTHARSRSPSKNSPKESSVPKFLNKRCSLYVDVRPKKKLKKSNTEFSNKEKGNEDVYKSQPASDPMIFILGQSLYEEFIKEEEKLRINLEEEFETFYSIPEIHHKYKAYFEEYNSKYSKAFSKNQSKEHKDEYWKIYWNKKLKLLEKNELDERVAELEQTYKLRAKELVLGNQDLNVKMGIELEEKDSNLYEVITIDDEYDKGCKDTYLKEASSSFKVVSSDVSSQKRVSDKPMESSTNSIIQRRTSENSCISLPTSASSPPVVPLSTEGSTLKSLFSNYKQNAAKQDTALSTEGSTLKSLFSNYQQNAAKQDITLSTEGSTLKTLCSNYNQNAAKQDTANHIIKSRFSVHGTITLLEQVSDKFGVLGPAVLGITESAKKLGLDTNKALSLFTEEENVILFQMAIDKLKIVQKSTLEGESPVLTQTIEWTAKLLDYSKNTCKLPKSEIQLNLQKIAMASFNKSTSFTLNLIKNALIYEGKIDPSKEEINEIFLKVCSIHVDMSSSVT